MATEKQIAANKRNAQKSTGPRTQQGKARSRMNAYRHGLSSAAAVASTLNDGPVSFGANSIAAVQDRLGQVYSERVKIISAFDKNLKHAGSSEVSIAVRRLAALERFSRRSYSEIKKYMRLADK